MESITISDHVRITLTFQSSSACSVERMWRLNESILDDKSVLETLSRTLALYFYILKQIYPGRCLVKQYGKTIRWLLEGN